MNIQLLVIDPQIDFCDPKGALSVGGADKDMERLAAMLIKHGDKIDDIRVTLDSHQIVHIAHPICWVDGKGNHPGIFTMITEDDVTGSNPKWRAFNPAWQKRQVDYVKALKAGGRYVLVIWPPHCLIGTPGHAVHPTFGAALADWQNRNFGMIDFVTKGSNPFTEHYSVVKADVPDAGDPTTNINTQFIQRLDEADIILVAGEALSHCVANSVRDIAAEFGDAHIKKFVLLEDATSSVGDQPGSTMFRDMADGFVKEMLGKGMQIAKTTTFFK
jgi:nicotinamidase/pyrazinamidase